MGLRRAVKGEGCVRKCACVWGVCACHRILARLALPSSSFFLQHQTANIASVYPKVTTLPACHASCPHLPADKVFVAAAALMKMSSKFLLSDGN